jgi:hypothetical protein
MNATKRYRHKNGPEHARGFYSWITTIICQASVQSHSASITMGRLYLLKRQHRTLLHYLIPVLQVYSVCSTTENIFLIEDHCLLGCDAVWMVQSYDGTYYLHVQKRIKRACFFLNVSKHLWDVMASKPRRHKPHSTPSNSGSHYKTLQCGEVIVRSRLEHKTYRICVFATLSRSISLLSFRCCHSIITQHSSVS